MNKEHWFWWLVTLAVMLWYCTITLYVGIRGALDIRDMLRQLKTGKKQGEQVPD